MFEHIGEAAGKRRSLVNTYASKISNVNFNAMKLFGSYEKFTGINIHLAEFELENPYLIRAINNMNKFLIFFSLYVYVCRGTAKCSLAE